jgi:hypothetical protein
MKLLVSEAYFGVPHCSSVSGGGWLVTGDWWPSVMV